MDASEDQRTKVALPPSATVFLVVASVLVATALGVALEPASGWLAGQEWVPARGAVRLVERFAGWAPLWGQVLAGVLVGVAVGLWLVSEATVVEVGRRDVVLVKGGKRTRWSRAQVGEAVLEGRLLSLRDHDDADLVAEKVDSDPGALRRALTDHGWPVRG